MSLGEAGKKRRKQIKSLRSIRSALLNQRYLSMQGRMAAAQQDAQEQAQKRPTRISIYDRYLR